MSSSYLSVHHVCSSVQPTRCSELSLVYSLSIQSGRDAQLQPWPWPIQPFYWQFFLEKTLFSSPQNTFFLQNRRWCLNISWILSTFLCRRATWTLTFKRLLFVFALHPTSQINIEFSAPCWDPMHAFCRSNLEEYNHYAENKILIMIARNILVYWWSQVKCY